MRKKIALLLVLIILIGTNTVTTLAARDRDETKPEAVVIESLVEVFPDLIFREINFSNKLNILQVYELVQWTTTTKKISENFQKLLDRSDEFTLQNYDRIYYEEVAQNGDILAKFVYNMTDGLWQKSIFDAAATEFDVSDYSQYKFANYQNFARQPKEYKGNPTKISCQVWQVMEGMDGRGTNGYMVSQDGIGAQTWFVTLKPPPGSNRILVNDWVTFYGQYMGLHTYRTTNGDDATVPGLIAESFEFNW